MQINPDLIASDGLWGGFQPCLGLVDMITSTPNPTTGLGNFTEIPKPSVIRTCTDYNSLYLHDGNALAGALEEPTPLLKVLRTQTWARYEGLYWDTIILLQCGQEGARYSVF